MSLHRIAALLAKAERTDNVHEAEAYLVKAQALATAASIDLAFARHAQAVPSVEPQSRTFTIGEPRKRSNKHLVALFITIAHNNDAHVDVAHNSTFVICYAMPSDLDVIEAMFTSLALQMSTAAHGWIKRGEWKAHSYVRQYRKRPHTAQTARAAFQTAYVERIAERFTLIDSTESTQGPSRYWRVAEAPNIRLGFISPHSHNFCSTCNRVRLTVEGRLLLCLGNEHSMDLKAVLRAHPGHPERLENAIIEAMKLKPYRHNFEVNDDVQVVRFMNMTGG